MERRVRACGGLVVGAAAAWVFLLGCLGVFGAGESGRREALLRAAEDGAIGELAMGLRDGNAVVRRTAARLLAVSGVAAEGALVEGLGNGDALVRRTALRALCGMRPEGALGWVERALADRDAAVRRVAVDWLIAREPRGEKETSLLLAARGDADSAIREVAAAALFPFYRENISLRDRKDYDHDVRVARVVELPRGGWGFRLDPGDVGHLRGWFLEKGAGGGWGGIEVGKSWEDQGHAYDGVGWYRLAFEAPAKPAKMAAVDLAFDGVDEAAWVWVNGEFVGAHDLGKAGWNRAFRLDVSSEIRWGAKNCLVVRVHDSGAAGGIWKPVRIEVLE